MEWRKVGGFPPPPGTQFKFKWLIFSGRREWRGQKNINSPLSPLPLQFPAGSQLSVACFSYKTLNALGKRTRNKHLFRKNTDLSLSVQTKGTCSAEPGTSYKVSDIWKNRLSVQNHGESATDWIWTIMFKLLLENTQRKAMSSIPIGASIPIWLLFVFGSGGRVAKCKHLHSKYSSKNMDEGGESSRQNLLSSSICFKDFICGLLQRKVAEAAINSLFMECTPCLQLFFDCFQIYSRH